MYQSIFSDPQLALFIVSVLIERLGGTASITQTNIDNMRKAASGMRGEVTLNLETGEATVTFTLTKKGEVPNGATLN